MAKEKATLWRIYIMSKCDASYKKYRKVNNKMVSLVRSSRIKFEKDVVKKGPKPFYSYIRQQITSKVSVPLALKNDLTLDITSDKKEVANIFAEKFSTSFVREPDNVPIPDLIAPRVLNAIEDVQFTPDLVTKCINTFRDDTAMGPDGIPAIVFKKCAPILSIPQAKIMKLSFEQCRLPSDWKEAIVTPIYKKGNRFIAANYRPISLTCIACKVMEKIIAKQIRKFLETENVIIDEQHGFVPKRSTVTNLLCCLDKWTNSWNNHDPVDVIYLDYEKAFDRVPIQRLISKLDHYGIRGNLLNWIKDFLSKRTFQVRIGDSLSEQFEVFSGVPQGSVLGPILFGIFLTDIKQVIKSELSLFVDDTKIIGNPIIGHSVIQDDLDRIIEWTKDWLLTLNIDKCTVLHMGSNNPRID
jgi:hypothetical protein